MVKAPSVRRTSAFLAALLGVVLSLVLVGTTSVQADAFAGVPPVIEGGVADGLITADEAECASLFVPGCAATTVAVVGLTLWATHDTWMPVLNKIFNPSAPEANPDGGYPCGNGAIPPSSYTQNSNTIHFDGTFDPSCFAWFNYASVTFSRYDHCEDASGQIAFRRVDAVFDLSNGNRGAPASTSEVAGDLASPCVSGEVPTDTDIVGQTSSANYSNTTAHGHFTWQIPDNLLQRNTTTHCEKPDGSTFDLNSGTVYGNTTQIPVPSCRASDPTSTPTGLTINTLGQLPKNLNIGNPQTDYPNCFGPSGLQCVTEVWVNGNPCGASGQPYHCVDWNSYRVENPDADVECKFGDYTLPIGNCLPLRDAYVTGVGSTMVPQGQTDGGYDWQPDYNGDGQPDPVPAPSPEPNPTPTTSPSPDPSTSPTTSPSPDPTPTPSTAPDGSPDGSPGGDPLANPNSDNCMSNGITWDPFTWVYRPVQCALEWAFVPKVSFSARIDVIRSAFGNKVPFSWFSPLTGMSASLSNACPNWTITIPGAIDHQSLVCDSSFVTRIRDSRPWLAGLMVCAAFWPLIRGLAYASIPLLKPTPSDPK